MPGLEVPGAKDAEVAIVVIKADGRVLPLGRVSYWHRNPLARLWWSLVGKPRADRRIRNANEVK